MCQNIEDFNRGAAFVLAALYQSFPVAAPLKVATLDVGDDLGDDERAARLAERFAVYEAGVVFLMEEGFVRYTGHVKGTGVFTGAVLTSKGLAALNRTAAPSIQRGPSVGERLIGFVKDTATAAVKDSVKQLVLSVLRSD